MRLIKEMCVDGKGGRARGVKKVDVLKRAGVSVEDRRPLPNSRERRQSV